MEWRDSRNLEKSLKLYIKTNTDADWSGVNVDIAFSYKEAELPFIAINNDSALHPKLELGSNILDTTDLVIIDIYGTGPAQVLDLKDYLISILKEGFIFYKFSPDPTDPTEQTKIAYGRAYVKIVGDTRVDVGESLDKCDKNRRRLTLEVERNKV